MYAPEVTTTLERNFYVDDLLKSTNNKENAVLLCKDLREMLGRGGLRLTKWMSNCPEVVDSIPPEERAKPSLTVNLEDDNEFERTLGLQWNIRDDAFFFDVHLKEKAPTRRGVLSVASSLYDPLGFVAPVTLIPKLILQNACRQGLTWDQKLNESDIEKWCDWLTNLPKLSSVIIERCLKASDLDISSCNVELHMFSDASQYAYGAAAYIKIYDRQGNGKCSFVMGKSRLAPIKTVTIPRLELAAAVVSVKLFQMLIKELDTKGDNCYFWTDSMIVLGYVRNTSRRFKTYVANRLALIHELTSPNDWRYVPTNMNPADLASRGVHPEEGGKLFIWLNGPKFLNMEKDDWPHEPDGITTEYEDVEMKPAVVTSMVQSQCQDVVSDILNRYSDWYKLQRAVAWLLRLKIFMIHRYLKHETKEIFTGGCLSLKEIKTARKLILMKVQESAYGDEFSKLTSNKKIATSSSLVKLCPVLNEGLLRVGGRFQ
ncbi:uncharacterized protein LOC128228545 [Mya arenaria]|uniref:uncharacterized protein LOC128228545 n=1 Tax=Mya arenaria TaxID=6604 RepID=UPI0022DEE383|nr:uncharacterized protein LOC128228545 [Mya arenaria]